MKYKPNDIIPNSGIYCELMINGMKITEIKCEKGEQFPPTLGKKNYFELKTVSFKQTLTARQ